MEIDVVMATNRAHNLDTLVVPINDRGRLHKLGSGSSVSSFRGSNLSLDTVSSLSEVFFSVTGDCEDVVIVGGFKKAVTRDAWSEFEDTVKNIDNTNYGYLTKKTKPNLVSSITFQRTMIDIYGNVEYGVNPRDEILEETPVKLALNCDRPESVMSAKAYDRKSNCASSTHEYTENSTTSEPELNAQANTYRTNTITEKDFNMVNTQTSYMLYEHGSQSHTLNWTLLRKRLSTLTDPEQARLDLYRRYGVIPTTLPDGQTRCENMMLSERSHTMTYGRTQNGKHNHRPASYHPPTTNLRSVSPFAKHRTVNHTHLPVVQKTYLNRRLNSGLLKDVDTRQISYKPGIHMRPHSSYQLNVQKMPQSAKRSNTINNYRRPATAK